MSIALADSRRCLTVITVLLLCVAVAQGQVGHERHAEVALDHSLSVPEPGALSLSGATHLDVDLPDHDPPD